MCKTFNEAGELLTGRCKNRRKLANNTYLERRGENIAVKLHETDVVTYTPDRCILNTGGWRTATTKARINEYSPVNLRQSKRIWYTGDNTPYFDNSEYNYSGELLNSENTPDNSRELELDKRIVKYANLCAKSLPLDKPNAGDCLYCQMERDGDNIDVEHITLHFEEGYVVPSLIWRALNRYSSQMAIWCAFGDYQARHNRADYANTQVKSAIKKYLRERFGLVR